MPKDIKGYNSTLGLKLSPDRNKYLNIFDTFGLAWFIIRADFNLKIVYF